MPRLKKPAAQKLTESINTPVTKPLKKRVVELAKAKGVHLTRLTRKWIERGAQEEQAVTPANKAEAPTA